MNLLKEIEPYQADIDRYLKGMGMTDRTKQQAIANIWDKFKNLPEVKAVIYPNVRTSSNIPPTDLACNDCFSRMINNIKTWQTRLNAEATVYFKGVPDVPKAKVTEVVKPTIKPSTVNVPVIDFSQMKMHQLRSIAKKVSIVYSNKTTKEQLIKLLNGKG